MTIRTTLARSLRGFRLNRDGGVAVIFALAVTPLVFVGGAAIDLARVGAQKGRLQAALDAGVLAGAKNGGDGWKQVAQDAFKAALGSQGTVPTPTFTAPAGGTYAGSLQSPVPMAFASVLGVNAITVGVSSTVSSAGGASDSSCILTLGSNQGSTEEALRFNGAPKVNLSGCVLRSNASIRCNGHDTGAKASIAAGTSSCSNPQSGASVVPDIHAALASNIVKKCGNESSNGVTWRAGGSLPQMITVAAASHTEYHVCGNLTLSGSGWLTGNAPATDTVIVIENGKLVLDDDANIQTARVTFVLTGGASTASAIVFPKGNGKAATLSVSPSTGSSNPWRGVSIYQDPAMTGDVDNNWGSGANLNVDGIVYLPNSDVTMHGNPGSNSPLCAKLVFKTLTSNGAVALNQSAQGCTSLGVKQYAESALRVAN
ncbi:MAG TPA: TadE/TadG family type IV pilus assembly protein [Beijerinckiaceae bacterium]